MFSPGFLRRYLLHTVILTILSVVAYTALSRPQVEFGDGREYIIQTQAIVFDGKLAINPEQRATYWNRTNPFNLELKASPHQVLSPASLAQASQFGGNFGALYFDKKGHLRYIHSWVYSAAVAPIYALLHWTVGESAEYRAFTIANLVFLFVPMVVLWLARPTLATLAFCVLLLASPLTPHLQCAHSEIFCFSCVILSFLSAPSKRWCFISPILLGVGAAQNIPIALFFPLQMWLTAHSRDDTCWFRTSALLPYTLGMAAPLGMIAYNFGCFGTGNLIAHTGQADLSFLSIQRMLSVFFSPIIGNVWYIPASWLALVIAVVQGRGWIALWFAASVLAVATLSSSTSNLNSAQFSACRYAVWYLAPLYTLPSLQLRGTQHQTPRWFGRTVLVACCVAIVLIQIFLGTWRFLLGDLMAFVSLQRATPEVAAIYRLTHFDDDIEPLVENIKGSEISVPHNFSGIYMWNLGKEESLWIFSKRALLLSPQIEVRTSADISETPAIRTLFHVTRKSSEVSLLSLKTEAQFKRHPVFGQYVIIWAPTRIIGIRAGALATIRE